jgi:hypothetical protein
MKTLSLIFFSCIASLSYASSKAELPPQSIFGVYANRTVVCFSGETPCEGPVLDYAMVIPTADKQARVDVDLNYSNGHSCHFEAGASWEDNGLTAIGDSDCKLRFRFNRNKLTIEDPDGNCRSYCGARGTLNDVTLPKRGAF